MRLAQTSMRESKEEARQERLNSARIQQKCTLLQVSYSYEVLQKVKTLCSF